MTKAETYERAWSLGYKRDFSLVDEIYHPEYLAFEDTTSEELTHDPSKGQYWNWEDYE